MTIISSELNSVQVPIDELIKLHDKLGKLRIGGSVKGKDFVYNVKDSDITSLESKKRYLEKGIKYLEVEITPKLTKYIIDEHPERYADFNLDPNVQICEYDQLRPNIYIREDITDTLGKIIVPRWTLLKPSHISLIKSYGIKKEYEIYEPENSNTEKIQQENMPVITIIDDQIFVTESLKLALNDYGLKIVTINDSENALNTIRINPPDLLLLDINMPKYNGFEILSSIKKFNNLKNIPIIMLSAKNSQKDIMYSFKLGAVDYILKPFNYKLILNKIINYLPKEKLTFELKNFSENKKLPSIETDNQKIDLDNIDDLLDKIEK